MIISDIDQNFITGNLPKNVEYNLVKGRGGSQKHKPVISLKDEFIIKSDRTVLKGGRLMSNLAWLNKLGSFLLLIIAIFVSYGLVTNTMFSTVGGFFILIISVTFAVIFWIYSIKVKESRC